MEKSNEVDRLEKMHADYRKMNVSEILDRIETIASGLLYEPQPEDIDELLGNAEETMELVAVVRAHLGLNVPDYDNPKNFRSNA